jgi:hypothetical protein
VSENGNGHKPTNRELAETDQAFRKVCEAAGIHPSRLQYRKWKWGRGAARAYERTHPLDNAATSSVMSAK